jgi:hypothetical protein
MNYQHLWIWENHFFVQNLHLSSMRNDWRSKKFVFSDFSSFDSSPTKRRPLEKENCSTLTTTSNTVLRTTSPYVTANDHIPSRSSLFSIEWYRSNIPRLLRRLVPIQIRENIQWWIIHYRHVDKQDFRKFILKQNWSDLRILSQRKKDRNI